MTLGQKLTSVRKQKGWTQGELGDMVNLAGNVEENTRKAKDAIPSQLIPIINKLEKLSAGNRAVIVSVEDAFIAKEKG
jgi:transcriptional regulator with XRE-family HTH domain